mgnify:FL=1
MKKYLLTLVNGELSYYEINTILNLRNTPFKILIKNNNFLILEIESLREFSRLGGIYKIVEITSENESIEKLYKNIKQNNEFFWLEEKARWCLSYYSVEKTDNIIYKKMSEYLNEEISKLVKKNKQIKNDIVEDNFREISVNKIKNITEIILAYDGKKFYLGKTKIVFNSTDYIKRDLSRPFQDSSISISPRIARILVNLLGLKNNQTVLDPFCGTGTFLIEASILGLNVMGTDKRKECVYGTRKNLQWINKNQKKMNSNIMINDAEKLVNFSKKSIDGIVTEPILLPNLKRHPNERKTKELLKITQKTYVKAMISMNRILRENGRLVIVTPRVKTNRGKFISLDILYMIKESGFRFNRIHKNNQPIIVKYSKEQKIIREVWVMQKKII